MATTPSGGDSGNWLMNLGRGGALPQQLAQTLPDFQSRLRRMQGGMGGLTRPLQNLPAIDYRPGLPGVPLDPSRRFPGIDNGPRLGQTPPPSPQTITTNAWGTTPRPGLGGSTGVGMPLPPTLMPDTSPQAFAPAPPEDPKGGFVPPPEPSNDFMATYQQGLREQAARNMMQGYMQSLSGQLGGSPWGANVAPTPGQYERPAAFGAPNPNPPGVTPPPAGVTGGGPTGTPIQPRGGPQFGGPTGARGYAQGGLVPQPQQIDALSRLLAARRMAQGGRGMPRPVMPMPR